MEEDNLVTVSVGPDNNKVVRKYEITKDGVVLVRSIYMSVRIYTSFYRPYNSIQNFFNTKHVKRIKIVCNLSFSR